MRTTVLRRTLAGSAVALAVALAAPPAAAQNVIDQQQLNSGASTSGFNTQWFAQSFRPTTGNVSGVGFVAVPLFAGTASGFITYQLYDRRPDQSGAVLLGEAQSPTTALPGFGARTFVDAFFVVPVAVTPGALYFFTARLTGLTAGVTGYNIAFSSDPDPYANGEAFFGSSTATGPYTATANDLAFRTYRSTATAVIPEPSTYALLAVGLAGVGARRRRISGG